MQHYSLKESAYRVIKEKLLNLEFEPGSRLREDLLAQEISMSRTPVREAINQLTAEGFIKNIPRKGIFAVELSSEDIKNLLDVREVLESLAIDNCIDKINKAKMLKLTDVMDRFQDALKQEKFNICNNLDSEFHMEIAQITENIKLIKFISEIEDFMHIARVMEKQSFPREKNEKTLLEHRKILEYIEIGNKEKAIEFAIININTMRENLGLQGGRLIKNMI